MPLPWLNSLETSETEQKKSQNQTKPTVRIHCGQWVSGNIC